MMKQGNKEREGEWSGVAFMELYSFFHTGNRSFPNQRFGPCKRPSPFLRLHAMMAEPLMVLNT
jgi:hypothetical protein